MRWLQRQVSVTSVEGYAAKVFRTERGVRIVPLAHGGTALDVDFVNELDILENNWDELKAIARLQDEASRAAAASA